MIFNRNKNCVQKKLIVMEFKGKKKERGVFYDKKFFRKTKRKSK